MVVEGRGEGRKRLVVLPFFEVGEGDADVCGG